jgi:acyl-CoA synthetase (AMP-forming)/AMP-acid ligase II
VSGNVLAGAVIVSHELRERAARFGDRVALRVIDGPTLTFAEWDARADALARGLVEAGVVMGDRVALLFANADAADFWVGFVAAHRAGAAAVPINARYAVREIAHVLRDSGARVALSAGEHLSRLRDLHGVDGGLVAGVDELSRPWLDAGPFEVAVGDDDLAELLYTSGTTGLPKGVVSTHGHSSKHGMRPLDAGGTMLSAIPLATFTGVQGALLTPLRLGVTSVVLPSFDTARFAELAQTLGAQWLLLVPAQILLLLEAGVLSRHDLSSVGVVMFGGSPTPPAAVAELAALLPGAVLINGYGLTEGGGSVCVLPAGEAARRPGSVGKPVGGVGLRVVDAAGDPVANGEVGEITLRLPAGERRYWNDDQANSRTFRDGWVHTGDLGKIDDEGFLYVVGRTKDVIIRGGYNITPVEVENALYEHPDVAEVAVVGIAHPVLGQDVCAVVRWRSGAKTPEVTEVRAFLADRIADYKRPRRIVSSPGPLPRTAAGKVDKAAVLALLGETDDHEVRPEHPEA